jgi:hypothetical protein
MHTPSGHSNTLLELISCLRCVELHESASSAVSPQLTPLAPRPLSPRSAPLPPFQLNPKPYTLNPEP